MSASCPQPKPEETPLCYADRLGIWYSAALPVAHKKAYGQYFTPKSVAGFMASLCHIEEGELRLLDPGAGTGVLTCAVGEHAARQGTKPARLYAELYETDPALAEVLKKSLAYLREWLSSYGISLEAAIRTDDFVMAHSEVLSNVLGETPSLFGLDFNARYFDLVVSNPPYFKIPKSDPRATAASAVIHGQPNIYALFMAASAVLLKPGGQLVFVTPRSFTSGPYFRLFRERFFAKMRPDRVHVFVSRTDAFKRDEILQESVILKARREDGWTASGEHGLISISSSNGARDFPARPPQKIPLDNVLLMSSSDKILHVPTTHHHLAVIEMVRSWTGSLKKLGLEVSTGPVVPFRAVPLLDADGAVPATHAPLLWMQNVKAMGVRWPALAGRKPQFIKVTEAALKLLVPNKNYVLMRRFSAKEERRRLVAAPYFGGQLPSHWLGLENHLNYIHRPGGELTEEEAWGLSVLLNCSMLDTYFRTLNGNTQVSATELRAMPLPGARTITELGREAQGSSTGVDDADALVVNVLGGPLRAASRAGFADAVGGCPRGSGVAATGG
jgi:adenine-specific DNA-methyltransferase